MESVLLRNVCLMNDLVNEMVCGSIIEKLCCFLEGKYIMFNYK